MNENKEDTSTWNAPLSSGLIKEGFNDDSTAFPVLYMKEKLENMRENKEIMKMEENKPNIFEQTNYKNIELFETIHEPFIESLKKSRGVKWKRKQARKRLKKKKKKKITSCAAITQSKNDKKDPVKELKRIYRECCDGIAAGVHYEKIPTELSGELNDKKSEKYITSQHSKWLQLRVGEFFVVMFTMVMTFSIMFYSTKTFETDYSSPFRILDAGGDGIVNALGAGVKNVFGALNVILELFLQDVISPFIFLLKTGFVFVPAVCNGFGLNKYPHLFFILVFGVFFGLIWAIYKKFDWFLKMFFDSFKWKINPTMFILVFVNIVISFIMKMIKPDNMFDEIFYRPKSLGALIVLLISVFVRILIALFLVPLAQMFFGFGFLLLFLIFPIFIFGLKMEKKPNAMTGGGDDFGSDMGSMFSSLAKGTSGLTELASGMPNIPNINDLASGANTSFSNDYNNIKNIGSNILSASDKIKDKKKDYWLKNLKTNNMSTENENLQESIFPILLSMPNLLKTSQMDITQKPNENPEWYEKYGLLFLQNIVYIIFMIFFIIHTASAAKLTTGIKSKFYSVYAFLNSAMVFVLLLVMYYNSNPQTS